VRAEAAARTAQSESELGELCRVQLQQQAKVRKTRSWPRSWANFSPLQLYSHRNAWANLHLLGQLDTFLGRRAWPRTGRPSGRSRRAQEAAPLRHSPEHTR
jgi:hypothetical protein